MGILELQIKSKNISNFNWNSWSYSLCRRVGPYSDPNLQHVINKKTSWHRVKVLQILIPTLASLEHGIKPPFSCWKSDIERSVSNCSGTRFLVHITHNPPPPTLLPSPSTTPLTCHLPCLPLKNSIRLQTEIKLEIIVFTFSYF